jgi:hypothetical protein
MGFDRKHHHGALRFWIHCLVERPRLTNRSLEWRRWLIAASRAGAGRQKQSEAVEMGRELADSNRHHRRSDFHHLDHLAVAVLLNARRLLDLGLKVGK